METVELEVNKYLSKSLYLSSSYTCLLDPGNCFPSPVLQEPHPKANNPIGKLAEEKKKISELLNLLLVVCVAIYVLSVQCLLKEL